MQTLELGSQSSDTDNSARVQQFWHCLIHMQCDCGEISNKYGLVRSRWVSWWLGLVLPFLTQCKNHLSSWEEVNKTWKCCSSVWDLRQIFSFLPQNGFYTPQQCLLCDSTELALGINKSHIWRRIEVDLKASQLICQSSPLPCHHSTHHKLQLTSNSPFLTRHGLTITMLSLLGIFLCLHFIILMALFLP